MIRTVRRLTVGAFAILSLYAVGCGGGSGTGGSNQPPPPPVPSFSIVVSPSDITVAQGSASQTTQISVIAQGGFSGTVSITMSGLPGGVTASPSSLSLAPGTPAAVTLSASSTAQVSRETIKVNGASGALASNGAFQLTVTGAPVPDPFHPTGGTVVDGFYDESRQLLFVTNIDLNELDVLSGQDLSIKRRVPIPQPWGIDQMADGKTLVIGTKAQEILTVDEDSLLVTPHPYAPGNTLFTPFFPNLVAMANGKVLIIGQTQGVDSSNIMDAGQYLYEWDSVANTFSQLEPGDSITFGTWEVESLARSADHKWAVFSADQFYLYSSDADSLTTASLTAVIPGGNGIVREYAINADGSKIAVANGLQVTFLDHSLAVLGSIPIQTGGTYRVSIHFSVDGSKLFFQQDYPIAIEGIDANAYTVLGYFSAIVNPENIEEKLLAIDSSGRAFVGIAGGVRVVDLTISPMQNPYFSGPSCPVTDYTLPANSSAQLPLNYAITDVSVYLGGLPAPVISGGTAISVPASPAAGAVDVECIDGSRNTAVIVDWVSYGVAPVGISANLLPPSGNPPVYVFGYGFSGTGETPSVTVGGRPVLATSTAQAAPGVLRVVAVLVPDGTPGESDAVSISSSLGSGTLASAVTYYSAPTIVPTAGLLQLLFDSHRNLVYALKATEVEVLDASTLQWRAPFSLPQPSTPVSYQIMALSPDGSRLVVGSADGHFVVLNPDTASQATLLTANLPTQVGSLAISKFNKVVLTGLPMVELDLSTLAFTTLVGNSSGGSGSVIRSSADGSHLYAADVNAGNGGVYSIDPAMYAVQSENFGRLFWTDLAVSADGSQFAAVDAPPYFAGAVVGFFDSGLHLLNANVYPDFGPPDDTGVMGAAFSPGGKVLLVALGDCLEFWDTARGTLRARMMTPERLHVMAYPEGPGAPMLALDSTGQTIYVASASGLMVLKLPQPLDQISPVPWPQASRLGTAQSALHGSIAARMAARHTRTPE